MLPPSRGSKQNPFCQSWLLMAVEHVREMDTVFVVVYCSKNILNSFKFVGRLHLQYGIDFLPPRLQFLLRPIHWVVGNGKSITYLKVGVKS
jgi:hypothetical protein